MSLEGLNSALGGFFRSQLERRSMWLVAFMAFLALLVVLNIGGIKPHEAGGTAHEGQTAHGGTSSAALHGQTAEPEGEAEAAGGLHGPEAMLQAEGLPLNYYPQGSHTYNLSQWLSGNRIGRWLLGDGLDWLHRAEGFAGFWALFGVLVALILGRVSKGAAHTFLGKGEDFYDR